MEVLGFLLFLLIAGMAFWILIFLAIFIPGWLTLGVIDKINPALAAKLAGHKEPEKPEDEE